MSADVVGKRAADVTARDHGAIGVLMAVLLGTGALVGLLALTVDMGRVYLESRTVQVGADAAAEGLAYECALNAAACASAANATTFAQGIVNANSSDGASGLEEVCGSTLGGCAGLSARPMDCATDPSGTAYVRVTTKTQTGSGDVLLTPFTDLLDGDASDGDGVTLWSCAQDRWGKVDYANVSLGLALPPCEFSIGGSTKVQLGVGTVLDTSCSVTVYSATGSTESQALGIFGAGAGPIEMPFLIDLGTGDCTVETQVTVPAVYPRFANAADGCSGAFLARLAQHIDSGRTVIVPMGWRDSALTVVARSLGAVHFLGYCTQSAAGGCSVGYGQLAGSGTWPNGCSSLRPCLFYEYVNAVVPYQEIVTTPNSTQPNFGVQTVVSLP
jgi:Flp pilus assembly protein TadG